MRGGNRHVRYETSRPCWKRHESVRKIIKKIGRKNAWQRFWQCFLKQEILSLNMFKVSKHQGKHADPHRRTFQDDRINIYTTEISDVYWHFRWLIQNGDLRTRKLKTFWSLVKFTSSFWATKTHQTFSWCFKHQEEGLPFTVQDWFWKNKVLVHLKMLLWRWLGFGVVFFLL